MSETNEATLIPSIKTIGACTEVKLDVTKLTEAKLTELSAQLNAVIGDDGFEKGITTSYTKLEAGKGVRWFVLIVIPDDEEYNSLKYTDRIVEVYKGVIQRSSVVRSDNRRPGKHVFNGVTIGSRVELNLLETVANLEEPSQSAIITMSDFIHPSNGSYVYTPKEYADVRGIIPFDQIEPSEFLYFKRYGMVCQITASAAETNLIGKNLRKYDVKILIIQRFKIHDEEKTFRFKFSHIEREITAPGTTQLYNVLMRTIPSVEKFGAFKDVTDLHCEMFTILSSILPEEFGPVGEATPVDADDVMNKLFTNNDSQRNSYVKTLPTKKTDGKRVIKRTRKSDFGKNTNPLSQSPDSVMEALEG